jgi:hypothetical protein
MIWLILGEGFCCKAKKIYEYSQTPEREGVLICFFFRGEVVVVVFV